jgi:hypothetical protein
MLAIHGTRRREIFRVIQASDGDVDSSWLLITLPAQHGPASPAELANHAGRRDEFRGLSLRVLEFASRDKEPRD